MRFAQHLTSLFRLICLLCAAYAGGYAAFGRDMGAKTLSPEYRVRLRVFPSRAFLEAYAPLTQLESRIRRERVLSVVVEPEGWDETTGVARR